MAHEKGIRLFTGIDVFAEGRVCRYNPLSSGFVNTSWQTEVYAVDDCGKPACSILCEKGD